jgi:hypothetical protein
VLHVQLPDGTTSLELQVFALVDGSEKVVATGALPVTPGKDFVKASVDELLNFLNTIHQLITAEPLTAYVPAI